MLPPPPHWMVLAPLSKSCLTIYATIDFWNVFSFGLYVCLYADTTVLWLKLCSGLWNRDAQVPSFVLYQGGFVCLGSLGIPYAVQDGFFCFCKKKKKNHWNFDRNCIESVNHFGKYWHTSNLKSLNPWTWKIYSSQQCFAVFNVQISYLLGASLIAQSVKSLPTMQETQVQFLGGEDPLENEMATHSSILTWRIL